MPIRLLKRIFGSSNDRIIKKLKEEVAQINKLHKEMLELTDTALQQKTIDFMKRLEQGETLEQLRNEAFAVVKEAAGRVLQMRHFDVQLIGGIVLHQGKIAEMRTGEGKTLMSTLAIYLNALTKKGVHVVTVNDYLAKRDCAWMGKLFNFLGLSTGCITQGISDEDRKAAYNADITYGTNNEFGFDYLRDNLKYSLNEMVQRPFNFAIIDEVDSILVDEARTPLVISGASDDNTNLYYQVDKLVKDIDKTYYEVDEKSRSVSFNESGAVHIEEVLQKHNLIDQALSLYDFQNITLLHHVNQALRAHVLFKKDVDYIIKDNKVMIIDEFTGRIMDGRRYSEGLHQALEAKEGLEVQSENQTIASITFQNYFRMYPKLAGMTGTAMTEAQEFFDIYKLDVVEIPTNVPITRIDEDDQVYLSLAQKDKAILREIEEAYNKGQPVLVGTISIQRSEYLSKLLKERGVKHNVLNARFHEQEAEIIAQAGVLKAVTIATNMAGRGTDIMLGGNPDIMLKNRLAGVKNPSDEKVRKIKDEIAKTIQEDKQKILDLGGMLVIATERHESRRIDNQLRGRAGRQGDAGRTIFYLSLEDDLLRIFGTDKLQSVFKAMRLKEDEAITAAMLSRSIEKAQKRIEARNYDIRKSLLKYDDVMNEQRKVIYQQRLTIMNSKDIIASVIDTAHDIVDEVFYEAVHHEGDTAALDVAPIAQEIHRIFSIDIDDLNIKENPNEALESTKAMISKLFAKKVELYSKEKLTDALRQLLMLTLDYMWKEHLHTLDHLRAGIGLRAYGQKDPLSEYKIESFNLFSRLLDDIATHSIMRAAHLHITYSNSEIANTIKAAPVFDVMNAKQVKHIESQEIDPSNPATWGKVSRNELCPCGSGKKYKSCHGKY